MEPNNIAETLRNYANRDDVDVVFKCVLAEAAATIESLQRENKHLRCYSIPCPCSYIKLDEEDHEPCE